MRPLRQETQRQGRHLQCVREGANADAGLVAAAKQAEAVEEAGVYQPPVQRTTVASQPSHLCRGGATSQILSFMRCIVTAECAHARGIGKVALWVSGCGGTSAVQGLGAAKRPKVRHPAPLEGGRGRGTAPHGCMATAGRTGKDDI